MTALLFYKSRDAQGAFGRHHDIKNRATTYCAAALNREILPNALPYTAHSKANQVFFSFRLAKYSSISFNELSSGVDTSTLWI